MSKNLILAIVLLVVAVLIGIIALVGFFGENTKEVQNSSTVINENTEENQNSFLSVSENNNENNQPNISEAPQSEVVAENLNTPWAIAWLPDSSMFVTERPGRVRFVDSSGNLVSEPVVEVSNVLEIGEGGLLGMALHPDFAQNKYVYLYYTHSDDGANTTNRVVRMVYQDGRLGDEQIIIDKIPGAANHNGGRLKFGPDGLLYVTTGDAGNPSVAQDMDSLGGKILRVTDEGAAAPDNPFGNLVYSYGHRNPQGLAWDSENRLWATEHGRSGAQSGFDELNLIEKGANYGWPEIEGDETREGMTAPVLHSGSTVTWAPAGMAYFSESVYFGGLRGQALYEATIGAAETELLQHLAGEVGRIREVILGPDGLIYITTSNRDGRGNPAETDDRIIRINPAKL